MIRIILIIIAVILALIAYFLFAPFGFSLVGDFDRKTIRFSLHDPLRLVDLLIDTSVEEKIDLRIFYLIKPLGKKKKQGTDADKSRHKDKKKSRGKRKGSLMDFVKKRLSLIIKNAFSFLAKCHIHIRSAVLSFSAGEPDTTALIYGGLASLPFMYGRQISVDADLLSDEAFIRGRIDAGGSIFVCILLYYVIKTIAAKGD